MAAHSCILNGRMQMKVNQDTRVHAFFAKESEKPTYAHKSESPWRVMRFFIRQSKSKQVFNEWKMEFVIIFKIGLKQAFVLHTV